jgi:hypothetical protein
MRNRDIPELTESDVQRFWSKVAIKGPDECWEWTSGKSRDGYGRITLRDSLPYFANRVAYFLSDGGQPGQLMVCHKCNRPSCCNPSHLFLGTQKDNVTDCINKGRRRSDVGEHNPRAKLTLDEVGQIRELYSSGNYTQPTLGKRFNVGRSAIGHIVRNETWRVQV